MKNLLILHGDADKTAVTYDFAAAYQKGAVQAGASVKEIHIMDLKFNSNKQFNNTISPLEPDLQAALEKILWANHIVLFCTVNKDSIPSRLSGFFDRLFMPGQVVSDKTPVRAMMYSGKTARIVSVLDQESWREWQETKKPTYHAIKRVVLERWKISPVRTCTIGFIHSPHNEYAKKWCEKLYSFGEKFM
ncbi:MAG TPA: NAD(P)H-dependent oxidoreductase [Chitinophaga sp.]